MSSYDGAVVTARRLQRWYDGARRQWERVGSRARGARGAASPGTGPVTIEYTPDLDGDPDPGEVVWAWVPYEDDPSQGKDRPMVVIGRRGGRLVAVPLTSKHRDREVQVPIGSGAWDRERRPSYARVSRLVDLEAGDMRREGSVLDRHRFGAVVAEVERLHPTTGPAGPRPGR